MAVSENDLEQLDAYLDDALDPREADALRGRLSGDGDLVAAMDQLRSERDLRRALFASFEPDDARVDALVSRVRADVRRRRRFAGLARPLRYAAAAAACVAVGFFARGPFDRAARPIDRGGGTSLVQGKSGVDVERVESYRVTLRDDAGRVVAVQRFDTAEKAREFAADLARWQSSNERLATGRVVLTADRF
jgi:hypothetical protein